VCVRVYVYTHAHAHTHTYIHIKYIYIYIRNELYRNSKVLVMSSLPQIVLDINTQYDGRTAAYRTLDLCRS